MFSSSLFQGPPVFTPKTRWPVIGAMFAGLAIVAAAVVGGGLAFAGCMAARDVPLTLDPASLQSAGGLFCQLAALAGQQVIFIILTLFAAGFFAESRRETLALRPPERPSIYVTAMLLIVPAVAAYTLLVWFISPADLVRDLGSLMPIIRSDSLWLALLTIGVGAPLSEELLFRGFLLPALSRSRLGFVGAAVLTTAAWTALHFTYSIFGLIEVFLIGLYFSWLLWRTGSLWVPIVCHAAYNTIVMLGLRFLPIPI